VELDGIDHNALEDGHCKVIFIFGIFPINRSLVTSLPKLRQISLDFLGKDGNK
jgi:hypothetical protein